MLQKELRPSLESPFQTNLKGSKAFVDRFLCQVSLGIFVQQTGARAGTAMLKTRGLRERLAVVAHIALAI